MEYRGILGKSVDYFYSLIDNQGIIQFSKGLMKDFEYGYAIEDQARALLVAIKLGDDKLIKKLTKIILRSKDISNGVRMLWDGEGKLRNEIDNFGEASGEVVWALGNLPEKYLTDNIQEFINYLVDGIKNSPYSRSWAYTLLGISQMNDRAKDIEEVANKLVLIYEVTAKGGWLWFEDWMYYANAIMPWAMLTAYTVAKNEKYKEIGLTSLDFLLKCQSKDGLPVVIGNNGWWQRGEEMPLWEQQPIDVAYTVLAALKAYEITGDNKYKEKAVWYFEWFYGNNLKKVQMVREDGGVCDGLGENRVNTNSGAESTVCYLLAGLSIKQL